MRAGPGVPPALVKVGDRAAGFTQGGTYADRGAYAEYVKAAADLVWTVPASVGWKEAATMGCSCVRHRLASVYG